MKLLKASLLMSAIAVSMTAPAYLIHAENNNNIKISSYRLHIRREPKSIEDFIIDTVDSDIGQAALKAAAAYFGVPPEVVTAARITAQQIKLNRKGDDTYIDIPMASGYNFCRMDITKNNYLGKGAVGISGDQIRKQVHIYTWTKTQNWMKSPSNVDIDIKFYQVPNESLDDLIKKKKCDKAGGRKIYLDDHWG